MSNACLCAMYVPLSMEPKKDARLHVLNMLCCMVSDGFAFPFFLRVLFLLRALLLLIVLPYADVGLRAAGFIIYYARLCVLIVLLRASLLVIVLPYADLVVRAAG